MSQKSREQSQSQESQEPTNTERDERDRHLTPDIDFPDESPKPGGGQS